LGNLALQPGGMPSYQPCSFVRRAFRDIRHLDTRARLPTQGRTGWPCSNRRILRGQSVFLCPAMDDGDSLRSLPATFVLVSKNPSHRMPANERRQRALALVLFSCDSIENLW